MSKLLWTFSSMDHRVAPLVFAIRRWAREASITQSTPGPWFSKFQMTILVLFYLQSIGILPKLNYFKEQTSNSDQNIANENDFHDDFAVLNELNNLRQTKSEVSNNQSLALLLKGFFAFYEKFDLQTSIVPLLKHDDLLKSSFSQSIKEKDWPTFLENPLIPLMNASKTLVESEGERFRRTCGTASDILSQPSANFRLLFSECHQTLPTDLIVKAYPAPLPIMPD